MIETTIYNYIKGKFPEIPVSMETPSPMPDTFITIEKTGAQYLGNGHLSATFAIQSWAKRKADAARLSDEVCRAMRDINTGPVIYAAGADYDFTDTTTKRYRYQAVFTVRYIEED